MGQLQMLDRADLLVLEKIAYFLGYARFLPSELGLQMRIDAHEMHTDLMEVIGRLKQSTEQWTPVACKFTPSLEAPPSGC